MVSSLVAIMLPVLYVIACLVSSILRFMDDKKTYQHQKLCVEMCTEVKCGLFRGASV